MASWIEQLPSGNWCARYTIPSGKKRSAGTFKHAARARKEAAIAEGKAADLGWKDPKAALRTWGAWCDEWWPTRGVEPGTLQREESPRRKYLMPRWGTVPLIEITRHDVKAWVTTMTAVGPGKPGLSPRTARRYLNIFTASLTAAVDNEILTSHPALKIKFANGQVDVRRYLTAAEQSKLLDVIPDEAQGLVNTMLGTGMRWGEALGLEIGRVDFRRGYIRVAHVWDARNRRVKDYPKGKKIRDVPIPDWVAAYLKEAIGGRTQGFVFAERHDIDNWRKRVWEVAVKESGIGHTRIHDLRHTYASVLLQDGVSLAEVGRLLGHVSAATTQIYAHLAETPRADVLRALKAPVRARGEDVGNSDVAWGGTTLGDAA